ncbi:hypothetical protein HUG10_21275 (plasmid) [Halorarum halophilum]|uniref:Uncharacterized protein n=1 Tax=Halorarum halophilum TaxID=2743090 RepID=A0A7D5K435_9EURY|nr:hypothetical protein [Halobaculum halophilum]QLG30121.1 hypothetical protein HUG10_21275 [Halobaculum halophilum]
MSNAAHTRMRGQAKPTTSRFSKVELDLEIPMDVALDAYFVFRESKNRCSDIMADALYYGIKEANHERSDVVKVETNYNDRAWKSWLVKICGERPWCATNDEQIENLEALADFLEGL